VSYWGAPMSSPNSGIRLFLKRLEVALTRHKPDHFIFESRAMADAAVNGRGVPARIVSVIPTGVDTDRFRPDLRDCEYAHQAFRIPRDRKIVFYSGHMEERKGVHVVIEAATELVRNRGRRDLHFLLLGNRDGQERQFAPLYVGTEAEEHVTFGGYRLDIDRILRSCYTGVIASTGWDSFPMSSLEMASSGLPLVASKLQGIVEGIEDGTTGYLFTPGDRIALADRIGQLADDDALRARMGVAARDWIMANFSRQLQVERLVNTMTELCAERRTLARG
jgi:glycosyltransferase involved in cell wall biosynthesis